MSFSTELSINDIKACQVAYFLNLPVSLISGSTSLLINHIKACSKGLTLLNHPGVYIFIICHVVSLHKVVLKPAEGADFLDSHVC